jgi:hypothetical protein
MDCLNPEVSEMEDRKEQREKTKSRIVERAQRDGEFKALLLKDPRKAVESELGITLPSHVQFQVVEESATKLCLVLPEAGKSELSDADLESVTGGAIDTLALMY